MAALELTLTAPTAGRQVGPPAARRPTEPLAVAGVLVGALLLVASMFATRGSESGPVVVLVVVLAAAAAVAVVASPMTALLLLVVASFTRLALPVPELPAEPMVLAFGGLVVAAVIAGARGHLEFRFGALEAAMLAYLAWNVLSAVLPHTYPAAVPTTGGAIAVHRFILTGTVLPFGAFVIGQALVRGLSRVRLVMALLVGLSAYSAVVSILQFTGPAALVWPRFIVDAPNYVERANGIFNQPVVNGLVMVAGFVTAVFLAHERTLSWFPRIAAAVVAVACVPGIYLTRTRAVWLVFALGLVLCAIFARGRRTGFVITIAVAVGFVALTWSSFTSSNRAAGGVSSVNEVDDRLNTVATSLTAIEQQPLLGWGIGRFAQVNTHLHQQWEPSIPFIRGYAIASHENELGIATELGLVGLALWLLVVALLIRALLGSMRRLPIDELHGRGLGLLAITVLSTWVVCGLTVDLRFFDFANLLVFLLVGAAVGNAVTRPTPTGVAA
jgi:O-antigen ligase